jgi:hypothetical protein
MREEEYSQMLVNRSMCSTTCFPQTIEGEQFGFIFTKHASRHSLKPLKVSEM